MKQQRLFRDSAKSFGGDLFTKRKGRGPRPLDTKSTMHLVLRSTQATGPKSFKRHRGLIDALLKKFADKYGITLHGFANVGNHLHVHFKLANRHTWRKFIRALTAAIAIKVGKKSRWAHKTKRFWDRRPFTRVVIGRRRFTTLTKYIKINILEGQGVDRDEAHAFLSG